MQEITTTIAAKSAEEREETSHAQVELGDGVTEDLSGHRSSSSPPPTAAAINDEAKDPFPSSLSARKQGASPSPPPTVAVAVAAVVAAVSDDDDELLEAEEKSTEKASSSPTPTAEPPVVPRQPPPKPPAPTSLHQQLRECLSSPQVIDVQKLRKLSSQGLPDEDELEEDEDNEMPCNGDDDNNKDAAMSYRGLTWRLLLGYIPSQRDEWPTILAQKRSLYVDFVNQWFQETTARDCNQEGGDELRRKVEPPKRPVRNRIPNSNCDEHHLMGESYSSVASASSNQDKETHQPQQRPSQTIVEVPSIIQEMWKKLGRDYHVLEGLLAPRTSPNEINALKWNDNDVSNNVANNNSDGQQQQQSSRSSGKDEDDKNSGNDKKKTNDPLSDLLESAILLDEIRKDVCRTHPDFSFYLHPVYGKRRYACLERILFVWSKYNCGVRYVQGMNEIVATLYYVLASDPCPTWSCYAETDTYWLLHTLLTENRDVFVPDLDLADTGIRGRISNMQDLLYKHDPETKEHLDDIGIDASFYAIRWWTTLLSREFLLPDVIRLWDSMFASTNKDNFLRYVCVTMVLLIRTELLKGDFSTCLRLLQSYPLHRTTCNGHESTMDSLLDSSRALWIYESQITVACHKGGLSLHQAVSAIKPPPALVMAFGLRNKNGSLVDDHFNHATSTTPTPSNLPSREQLEQASEKAAEKMREAKQAVSVSASAFFGRAKGLYSKYSQEYAKKRRDKLAASSASSNASASSEDEDIATPKTTTPLSSSHNDESNNVNNHKEKDVPSPTTTMSSSSTATTTTTTISSFENAAGGSSAAQPQDRPEDCIYMEAFK